MRHNIREPEEYFDSSQVSVLAELAGEDARDVVDFIDQQPPRYPCRDLYIYYPGPNCNTYPQWALDKTGRDVRLLPTALGKDMPVVCW